MKNKNLLIYILFILLNFLIMSLLYLYSISNGGIGLGLKFTSSGDDGVYYYHIANEVWKGVGHDFINLQPIVLGGVMKIMGTNEVYILRLFNFIPVIFIPYFLFKLSEKKNVVFLFLYLLVYPSLVFVLNYSLYRDGWIILLYLISLTLIKNFNNKINILLLVPTLVILFFYREYVVLSLLISLTYYYLIVYRKIKFKYVIYATFALILPIYLFVPDLHIPIVDLSLNEALAFREKNAEIYQGTSQFNIKLSNLPLHIFILNFIKSILLNIFGPLTLSFYSAFFLIVFAFESLVFIYVSFVILKRRKSLSTFNLFLLATSIIWFLLVGIINDNLGTGLRLRILGWLPILTIFTDVTYKGDAK